MAKRKYYKKRYYKKSNNDYNDDYIEWLIKLIAIAIVLLWISSYWIYIKYIKPNLNEIILGLKIFIPFLIISIILIIYYFYKKRKEEERKKIEETPKFLLDLENKIKEFKPLRHYWKEEPYQIELAWYLKNNYKDLDIEQTKNYTRPDIIIDDIAIEIKGPTTMAELKTIPHKIITYLKEWEHLYIVLFNIQITNDIDKSKEIYNIWKKDILETFENKKDRITIIEI